MGNVGISDAAQEQAAGRGDCRVGTMGEKWCRLAAGDRSQWACPPGFVRYRGTPGGALVLAVARGDPATQSQGRLLAHRTGGPVPDGTARTSRTGTGPSRRPQNLDSSRELRSARLAARPGGGRIVCRGRIGGRICQACRSAASVTALWPAVGAALAGSGPIRRVARPRIRSDDPQRLAVPGLRGSRTECGCPL